MSSSEWESCSKVKSNRRPIVLLVATNGNENGDGDGDGDGGGGGGGSGGDGDKDVILQVNICIVK